MVFIVEELKMLIRNMIDGKRRAGFLSSVTVAICLIMFPVDVNAAAINLIPSTTAPVYDKVVITVNGTKQWVKTVGGSGVDLINDIVATPDGAFLVTGYSMMNSGDFTDSQFYGDSDIFIGKLSNNGSVIFTKFFGGTNGDTGCFCQSETSIN